MRGLGVDFNCIGAKRLSSSSRLIQLWFGLNQNAPKWFEQSIWTGEFLAQYKVTEVTDTDVEDNHLGPVLKIKMHGCSLPAKSCHSTSRTAYFSQNTCMHLQNLRPLNICQICYRNLAIRTSIFISCIEWLMDVAYFKCHVLVSLLQWPLYYCVDLAVACLLSFSDAHC